MRKLLLLALVPLALAFAAPATAATPVLITSGGFDPVQITVGAGDTVTWTNNDSIKRQVVADGGAFTSPVLLPDQSWSYRFARAGAFAYHDQLKSAQKGTVTVRGTATRSVTITAGQRAVTLGSTI